MDITAVSTIYANKQLSAARTTRAGLVLYYFKTLTATSPSAESVSGGANSRPAVRRDQIVKVLVAVADRDFGHLIAEFVSKHIWEPGTEIKILNVEQLDRDETPGPFYADLSTKEKEALDRASSHLVNDLKKHIEPSLSAGVTIHTEVRPGTPKEEIMEVVEEWPADMLIMGSHARGGFSRFMLGSVSHAVMTHVSCSMVIIRKQK